MQKTGEVGNEDHPNHACAEDVFDDDEMFYDPSTKPDQDEDVVVNDDSGQHSNMYDRMKAQPRRRFKSGVTRTPFSVYGNKKNLKLKWPTLGWDVGDFELQKCSNGFTFFFVILSDDFYLDVIIAIPSVICTFFLY